MLAQRTCASCGAELDEAAGILFCLCCDLRMDHEDEDDAA